METDPVFAEATFIGGRAFSFTRPQVISDADYFRSATYNKYLKPFDVHHRLISVYQRRDRDTFSIIHLHRGSRERDFSDRELQLLSFFHDEIGGLIGRALVSAGEPNPESLSPRLRQTLACLLEGDSEKEVAVRLRLSQPTTHQYVTSLYQHFGVRSRAQLMALALKRIARPGWRGIHAQASRDSSV